MKKRTKIIGVCALTMGAAVAAVTFYKESTKKLPVAVVIESVFTNDFEQRRKVPSMLQASEEFYLSIRTGGELEEVLVNPGEAIRKNQVVAVVDKAKRMSELERAFSNFELARTDMQRIRRLYSQGAATRQEWDDAQNRISVSKTDLKDAKQNLEDAVVRSPTDGVLAFFAFHVGDYIPNGSRVAVVENRTEYRAVAKIPYNLANRLTNSLNLEIAAYDPERGRAVGEILEISATFKRLGITSDYDAGKTDIEFRFPQPMRFPVGQAVLITFVETKYPQVQIVPSSVLLRRDSQDVVTARHKQTQKLEFLPVTIIETGMEKTVLMPLAKEWDVLQPHSAWNQQIAKDLAAKGRKAG